MDTCISPHGIVHPRESKMSKDRQTPSTTSLNHLARLPCSIASITLSKSSSNAMSPPALSPRNGRRIEHRPRIACTRVGIVNMFWTTSLSPPHSCFQVRTHDQFDSGHVIIFNRALLASKMIDHLFSSFIFAPNTEF